MIVLAATLLGASTASQAWWGGPHGNDGFGDFFGDGDFNFNFSMRGNGNGYGRGYDGYGPYGYAPYGYGPYAYAPGVAPVQAPQAPATK